MKQIGWLAGLLMAGLCAAGAEEKLPPVQALGSPAECTYSLSFTNWAPSAGGATTNVLVSASPAGCSWTITGACDWLAVTNLGSGTNRITATDNTNPAPRSCTLSIAGIPWTVTQQPLVLGSLVSVTCPALIELGALPTAEVTVHNPPSGMDWAFPGFSESWAIVLRSLWLDAYYDETFYDTNGPVHPGQTKTSVFTSSYAPFELGVHSNSVYAFQGLYVSAQGTFEFQQLSNSPQTYGFEVVAAEPPQITILEPANGARVLTNSILLKGTASDNLRLAKVVWIANDVTNQTALAATNSSQWEASVPLHAGTNWLRVWALDEADLSSPVVTQSVYYAAFSPVTLLADGPGSLSGLASGQSLEVGLSYTVVCQPASNCVVARWTDQTGRVLSTLPACSFVMESNLVLTAHVVYIEAPFVQITSPATGTRAGSSVQVRGTATNNTALASVWCQLNGGSWIQPAGLNSWAIDITLAPGSNVFLVRATDTAGNTSPVLTLRLTPAGASQWDAQTGEMILWTLYPGYNLASVPFENTGLATAESLASSLPGCDTVWKWDASAQRWSRHVKGGDNDFAISPGDAFFFHAATRASFAMSGLRPSAPVVNLKPGYNLVCPPISRQTLTNAEALLASPPQCDALWKWDPAAQLWSGHVKARGNNFATEPGRAYLLWSAASAAW